MLQGHSPWQLIDMHQSKEKKPSVTPKSNTFVHLPYLNTLLIALYEIMAIALVIGAERSIFILFNKNCILLSMFSKDFHFPMEIQSHLVTKNKISKI